MYRPCIQEGSPNYHNRTFSSARNSNRICFIKDNRQEKTCLFCFLFDAVFIKTRIERIEIFTVHFIRCKSETLTEALEMNNFSFTKEFDWLAHIRVVNKTQNVIVSCSSLLLCWVCVRATNNSRYLVFSRLFSILLVFYIF